MIEPMSQRIAGIVGGLGPESTIDYYRRILEDYPDWVNVHYNLGHALMALGRHAEAIPEFRRTIALDPKLSAAHLHLATCLAAVGDAAESKREREIYEQGHPSTSPAKSTLALQK